MAVREEASKGKRQAVRAAPKDFRAMLFGLLSPKCSTRESVMLTEIPSAIGAGKVMGGINEKGPQGFQDGGRATGETQMRSASYFIRLPTCECVGIKGPRWSRTDLEDTE